MPEQPRPNICEEGHFRELFQELGASLRNFLYYKSGDLQRAEDISQEAFVKLWQACARVAPDKARAYLYRVANNLFLDRVKHDKVVLKFQQQQSTSVQVDSKNPERLLEAEELRERLTAAISALPEKSRTVFLLNRIDGLSYQEMADRLGISKKAVEKRMSKALVELRRQIKTD
ncbi:MAG: RNA polymerase sigma-70 factor [Bacteroidota bacterium]